MAARTTIRSARVTEGRRLIKASTLEEMLGEDVDDGGQNEKEEQRKMKNMPEPKKTLVKREGSRLLDGRHI